jgi:hypothetical protein
MQITAIKFTEDEEKQIFNTLIEKFNPQKCAENKNGHTIEFNVNDLIEIEATLSLNVEYSEYDSNHQSSPIDVYTQFKMTFYNNDEEVSGMENSSIYTMIETYNWIKYF